MSIFLWHGVLMAIAWLVLLPAGVVAARFYKVLPGQDFPRELDNPVWWRLHRLLQYGGLMVAAVGFWLAFSALGRRLSWQPAHPAIGLAALGLGASQLVSALLRGTKGGPTDPRADPRDPSTWRGDHYDMTARRRLFEAWHKSAGYAALALAVVAAWTGAGLAGLPAWAHAATALAVAIFAALFARLTWLGRRVDTFRAIWGITAEEARTTRPGQAGLAARPSWPQGPGPSPETGPPG